MLVLVPGWHTLPPAEGGLPEGRTRALLGVVVDLVPGNKITARVPGFIYGVSATRQAQRQHFT